LFGFGLPSLSPRLKCTHLFINLSSLLGYLSRIFLDILPAVYKWVMLKNRMLYHTPMPKTKAKEKMVLISVHLPKQMLDELEVLVSQGKFPSRSEAIRVAVRDLIYRENGLRQRELELEQLMIPGR
jgi:hypothetical protein